MHGSRFKVLIIDDHAELLFGLSVLLGSVGFDVDTVESGEEGIDRLRESHYDAIVVDFRLPGMSGGDFIEIVRHRASTQQIPIIALTASVMRLEECMLAGATRGLNKPCKFDDLIAELKSVINWSDKIEAERTERTDRSSSTGISAIR